MGGTSFSICCANGEYNEYDHPNEHPCPVQPELKGCYDTASEAIAAWNTRTTSALLEKALKALQHIRHEDSRWHDDDLVTPLIAELTAQKG
jgi:hypothetical protein